MNVPSWIPIERPPAEHRRSSRADVHIEIDDMSDHNFWSGLSANMSEGGVFIATHHSIPIGSRLFVQFRIPDGGEPIVTLTEVLWVRLYDVDGAPPGIGVRFIAIDAKALARVSSFVTRRREPLLFES